MQILETHIVAELDRGTGVDVLHKVHVLGDEYDLSVKDVYVLEIQGHLRRISLEDFRELQKRPI